MKIFIKKVLQVGQMIPRNAPTTMLWYFQIYFVERCISIDETL